MVPQCPAARDARRRKVLALAPKKKKRMFHKRIRSTPQCFKVSRGWIEPGHGASGRQHYMLSAYRTPPLRLQSVKKPLRPVLSKDDAGHRFFLSRGRPARFQRAEARIDHQRRAETIINGVGFRPDGGSRHRRHTVVLEDVLNPIPLTPRHCFHTPPRQSLSPLNEDDESRKVLWPLEKPAVAVPARASPWRQDRASRGFHSLTDFRLCSSPRGDSCYSAIHAADDNRLSAPCKFESTTFVLPTPVSPVTRFRAGSRDSSLLLLPHRSKPSPRPRCAFGLFWAQPWANEPPAPMMPCAPIRRGRGLFIFFFFFTNPRLLKAFDRSHRLRAAFPFFHWAVERRDSPSHPLPLIQLFSLPPSAPSGRTCGSIDAAKSMKVPCRVGLIQPRRRPIVRPFRFLLKPHRHNSSWEIGARPTLIEGPFPSRSRESASTGENPSQ